MQVYRLLHGTWISKGYMRDAAWAYTKLKRLETKTYLPQFAWIIYNRKIPERISNKKYMRALKKISNQQDKTKFEESYENLNPCAQWTLKKNLKSAELVRLREIFIWYKLPPLFTFRNCFKKFPKCICYLFIDLICGFGESLNRIALSLVFLILFFALYTFLTNSIVSSSNETLDIADHLLFSLRNLSNANPGQLVLANKSAELFATLQATLGIALIGLFGFVLGNNIRNR